MAEEIIQDAEVEEVKNPVAETPEETEKRTKRDFYIELALFLILGVLIGIAVKNEAAKRITIGFNDYKMKLGAQHYNINNLQTELISKQSNAAENGEGENGEGGTCSSNQ